jgi:hypothetical protein
MVNPDTGQVEDAIPTLDAPDQIAISSDGQYLYVGIDAKAVVRRYPLPSHTSDLDIAVGTPPLPGYAVFPIAVAVLPNQSQSILAANGSTLAVYDGAVRRSQTAPLIFAYYQSASLYVRPGNGNIYAYSQGVISYLSVTAAGVGISAGIPAFPYPTANANFGGGLATDNWGYVFDLDSKALLGRLGLTGEAPRCITVADPSGASVLAVSSNVTGPTLVGRYSLANFQPVQTAPLSLPYLDANTSVLEVFGTDGIALVYSQGILFGHTSGLAAVTAGPPPTPVTDALGAIHLAVPAGGLLFDPLRKWIWASVQGSGGSVANSLIAVDPSSGNVETSMYVGSEPGALAISGDQQRIFAVLKGSPPSYRSISHRKAWRRHIRSALRPRNMPTRDCGTPSRLRSCRENRTA